MIPSRRMPLLIALVFWFLVLSESITPSEAASLDAFLAERTGGSDGSKGVWIYSGQLCDPIDGKEICQVEGLELVRQLPEGSNKNLLKVQQDIADLDGNRNKLATTTLLSRKLFVYHTTSTGERDGRIRQPLRSIRLRPKSPEQEIPLEQAVVCYDTATTYVRRRDSGHVKEFVVHTEFPDGKLYAGASKVVSATPNALEFTVFAKKYSRDQAKQNNLFSRLLSPRNQSGVPSGITVGLKRSKFIEFGAGPKQDNRRFGARETYSYRIDQKEEDGDGTASTIPIWRRLWKLGSSSPPSPKNLVSLKYTRYGEGPPWYQVGKMCQLELQGERVDSIDEAPPLCASIAATMIPGFLVVDTPVESAGDALEWFRQDSCRLYVEKDDEKSDILGGRATAGSARRRLIRRFKKAGVKGWERLRKASQWKPPPIDGI